MTPQFTSFVTLRVKPSQEQVVFEKPAMEPSGSAQGNYMRSQSAAFKSRRVILAALRQDEVKPRSTPGRPLPRPRRLWSRNADARRRLEDGSEFLTISLNAADPTDALTVLKNLTNSYMDEMVYGEQTAKAARLADVEKVYTDTGSNLKAASGRAQGDAERITGRSSASTRAATSHDFSAEA